MRVNTLAASQLRSVLGTCPPPNLDAIMRVKTLSRGSRVKTLPDTTVRVKTLSLRRLG